MICNIKSFINSWISSFSLVLDLAPLKVVALDESLDLLNDSEKYSRVRTCLGPNKYKKYLCK